MLEEIITCLGGADNIITATNCMTRLRIMVSDEAKVDEAKLKGNSDVMGLVHDFSSSVVGVFTSDCIFCRFMIW